MKIQLTDRWRLTITALAVGIFIIVATISLVVYVPQRYMEKLEWKWFRFSLDTAFIVWFSLKAYWKLRKSGIFWGIFSAFLFVHGLGVGYFYYVGRGLGMLEIALVSGTEWGCMAVIIYWVLHATPEFRQDSSRSPWSPTI